LKNYKITKLVKLHILLRNSFFLFFSLLFTGLIYSQPPPVANFTANNTVVCIGQTISFTNASTGSINSYSWNFGAGAIPSTANTAGPHSVFYSTNGVKTITLTVTGPGGNSTETKTNFIKIGADRIKLMTYNLLNYPDLDGGTITADTSLRHPFYRTIISATDPDILVVQELLTENGLNAFLNSVMNANGAIYSAGTFINGYDTDNGIYYKTAKYSFISNTPIETELRDISEFKLKHLLTGDTLRIYSVHLKSSDTGPDEDQRAREIDSLRKKTNTLAAGSHFIVCGDFNIYKSSESAYQKLLLDDANNEGHFIDPITLTGTWNNPSYAQYHTQSPRIRAFGGGATGGLDDRFDMILYSSAISLSGGMTYVSGSLKVFGNDGTLHNDSINDPSNTAVSPSVANALHNASDHIPVISEFDIELNNCLTTDLGAYLILNQQDSICPDPGKALSVRIKNYGINSINFSTNNANVIIEVTKPNATIQTFSKVINSGSLAVNTTMDVSFTGTLDMSALGNYHFKAYTQYAPDANHLNDTLPIDTVVVGLFGTGTISADGPTTFCNGDTLTLTAGIGSNYLWSNGSTLQAIQVTTSGSYTVSYVNTSGCPVNSAAVLVTVNNFLMNGTLFTETMGNSGGTIAISTHENNNGFDNDNFTMTGTGDVRTSLASSGYSNASGLSNVFFTNTAGKDFIISGINTLGLSNLQLSFGIYKSTIASNGSEFLVQVSTDGVNYSSLSYPALPTGSGTALWHYRTITAGIPSSSTIYIKFLQTLTSTSLNFRIDDISLSYTSGTATISTTGSSSICPTGFVILNATPAVSYLWNTGATTSSINVSTPGNYSCVLTGANGCTLKSNTMVVAGGPTTWFSDYDNDGYGTPFDSLVACTQPPGYVASNTDCKDSLISVNPAAAEICWNLMDDNCNGLVDDNCPSTISLNVKLFIEGFYLGNDRLRVVSNPVSSPATCDTITVSIATSTFPNSIVLSFNTLLDTSGNTSVQFNSSGIIGNSYYIVIQHRNALETWSSLPILFNQAVINYDFTTSASQAYSGNLINLGDGNFALYSGDLDHDGQIDIDDFNLLKSAAQNFQDGYIDCDLTGDRLVESADFTLIENNLIRILARP
jgi:PKD repeat protein